MATAAQRVAAGIHWKNFTEASLERDARQWLLDVVLRSQATASDGRSSRTTFVPELLATSAKLPSGAMSMPSGVRKPFMWVTAFVWRSMRLTVLPL